MMSKNLRAILDLLSCPDDGQPLRLANTQLACNGCGRAFPLHGESLVELLPSRPAPLPALVSAEYRNAYLMLFEQQFQEYNTCVAWGAEEAATASWIRKRRRQVLVVQPLVIEGTAPNASVLCDIFLAHRLFPAALSEFPRPPSLPGHANPRRRTRFHAAEIDSGLFEADGKSGR